jgi:glycerol-3-phosphate acyltransferase PlsY
MYLIFIFFYFVSFLRILQLNQMFKYIKDFYTPKFVKILNLPLFINKKLLGKTSLIPLNFHVFCRHPHNIQKLSLWCIKVYFTSSFPQH